MKHGRCWSLRGGILIAWLVLVAVIGCMKADVRLRVANHSNYNIVVDVSVNGRTLGSAYCSRRDTCPIRLWGSSWEYEFDKTDCVSIIAYTHVWRDSVKGDEMPVRGIDSILSVQRLCASTIDTSTWLVVFDEDRGFIFDP